MRCILVFSIDTTIYVSENKKLPADLMITQSICSLVQILLIYSVRGSLKSLSVFYFPTAHMACACHCSLYWDSIHIYKALAVRIMCLVYLYCMSDQESSSVYFPVWRSQCNSNHTFFTGCGLDAQR